MQESPLRGHCLNWPARAGQTPGPAPTQTDLFDALALAIVLNQIGNDFGASMLKAAGNRSPLIVVEGDFTFRNAQTPIKLAGQSQTSGYSSMDEAGIQIRRRTLRAAQHIEENLFENRLSFHAQPLRLVFFFLRNKTEQLGNPRVYPAWRVRERNRLQRPETRAFPKSEHSRPTVAFFIESENQRAVER